MPSETMTTGFEGPAAKPIEAPVPVAQEKLAEAVSKPSYAGYPVSKWHPVYGRKDANDPNEASAMFQPPHNWFDTPGEADMHRTDREAQQVIQHNLATKVADKIALVNGDKPPADAVRKAIVRNSVQAQESVDSGKVEPL